MASGFSLKDQLFNRDKVQYLAGLFAAADPGFNGPGFQAQVMERLPELELKARIDWIAEVLDQRLPADFFVMVDVVERALPPPLDPALTDDDFGDFIFAPLGELMVRRGLQTHPGRALEAIEQITQRFSMEWAIRPFLNRWPDDTLARMQGWTRHPHYHVRRLVSEGTRPRLPWGQAVGLEPGDPLHLLDRLHADPTRYVTRSVANHLNDIAKKDPDLAMDRLADWAQTGAQDPDELRWISAHALRGLVKSGHPRALSMLGYDPGAVLETRLRVDTPRVRIGGTLEFSCHLRAAHPTPVLVDYRLHFPRPGGRRTVKVYKLKQAETGPGGLELTKRHRLKADATTYTLVPGPHRIEIMVNGKIRDAAEIELLD